MLDPAVDLADDLHGLACFVVEREQEDGRVHDPRDLGVQRVE